MKLSISTANLPTISCLQQLQGKSFPNWDLQQTGSGEGVDEQISGDCDDEDGCGGSGSGEFKRVLKITDRESMILFPSYI